MLLTLTRLWCRHLSAWSVQIKEAGLTIKVRHVKISNRSRMQRYLDAQNDLLRSLDALNDLLRRLDAQKDLQRCLDSLNDLQRCLNALNDLLRCLDALNDLLRCLNDLDDLQYLVPLPAIPKMKKEYKNLRRTLRETTNQKDAWWEGRASFH
ncbi:hypothetical protein Bpfe_025145 [Biomphalaria pfeifferi]|uniref:Uncharacterized protein n=1 Tax=Biomphalaria pfeifferi TaxID=112525 RepID=A0AAD8AZU3_BIOPF|nr:hypothetical protein Bpfe_025145 [Biomphalaria pfeifferi]